MPTIRFESDQPERDKIRDKFLKSLGLDPLLWGEDQEFELQPGMTPVIFRMRCDVPAFLQKTTQWVARITVEAGSLRFMVGDHVWAASVSSSKDELLYEIARDGIKARAAILSTIKKLPEEVTSLRLADHKCKPLTDVNALAGLKNLIRLDLTECTSLTDVSALAGLKNLTSLRLDKCESLTDVSGLGELKNLASLYLRGWALGTCPLTDVSALAGLKNLTSLYLTHCSLTDVSALSDLKNLTSLDLSSCNSLTDVSGLSELKNLTSLDFLYCQSLTNVNGLAGLKNLTRLNLSWCQSLTNVNGLAGLKNLTSLDLSQCRIKDAGGLAGLENLTSLKLSGCPLTDVSALGELKNLTSLSLGGCPLTDVSALGGCKNLTSLVLSNCKSLDLSGLGELKNLTSLDLSNCESLDLSGLGELKNLTNLDLSHCPLTDVSGLAGFKNLTSLDLSWCPNLADLSGLGELKNLTSLDLSYCESLDLSGLGELKNLTNLDLSKCPLTDVSGLAGFKNLTSLDLTWCKSLTNVSALGELTNLTSLNLRLCQALTDVSALGELKNLTSLDLSGCESVTDVSALGELKNLTSLDLSGCESIRKLPPLTSLRHLKSLKIKECGRINSVAPFREIPALQKVEGWPNPDQISELLAHTAVLRSDTAFIKGHGGKWCAQFLKMHEATLEDWEQFATTLGEALSLLGESPHEESYEDCLRGKPEISADPWKAWFSGTRKVSGWELMKNRIERQELTKASPGFVGGVCASLVGEDADKDEQDWAIRWLRQMEEAWSKRGKELVTVAAEICVGLLRCNMEEEQKNWLKLFTDDSDPALLDPVQAALGNWRLGRDQFDEALGHATAIKTVARRDPLLVELAKRYVRVRPARAGEILLTVGSSQLRKDLMEILAGEPDFVAEPANVECLVVACGDSAESLAKLIEILPAGTDHALMEELSLGALKNTEDFSELHRRCLERLLEQCS